jgi:hypothetical protein
VLRKIFGLKRDEVTGERRRIHDEEVYVLYSSLNIIRVIKSRRVRWLGDVACVWERQEVHIGVWWGDLRERVHLEDLRVDGRIILKCIQEVGWDGGTGLIWLRIGTGGGRLRMPL